jgi:uncharacterized protein YkwD
MGAFYPGVEVLEHRDACSAVAMAPHGHGHRHRHRAAHLAAAGLSAAEARLLAAVNGARLAHDSASLHVEPRLQAAAEALARRQASADVYTGDAGFVAAVEATGYPWTALGSNAADNWGYRDPIGQLLDQWFGSAEHVANLLNPAYADTGIAVARSAGGVTYAVEEFGRR